MLRPSRENLAGLDDEEKSSLLLAEKAGLGGGLGFRLPGRLGGFVLGLIVEPCRWGQGPAPRPALFVRGATLG